jgi:monoamine oxidase
MAELDQETLASFVRSHTHSERGRWWLTAKLRSDEGDDLDQIGLLGWLSGYLHYLDREDDAMSAFRIPEGGEFFCQRLARSLRAPVELDRVLQRVIQSPTGVKLEFTDGMVEVDRVILTLPPPALERVIFEPALSVEKRCAVEACRMSRAVKICWEFSEPWWKDQGWGGRMLCDGPLQQTWDGGQGEAAILTAYVCGKEAVAWNTLGDPVRAGIYELSQLFPEAAKTFKRGWWHDWVTDPFARGAFSHLAPGYVLEHMGHIAPPQGRIHFAGEHTALWTGFIEGALESAERVVTEIIAIEAEP